MLYGELELEIDIASRIISIWDKLLSGKVLKCSKITFMFLYIIYQSQTSNILRG